MSSMSLIPSYKSVDTSLPTVAGGSTDHRHQHGCQYLLWFFTRTGAGLGVLMFQEEGPYCLKALLS